MIKRPSREEIDAIQILEGDLDEYLHAVETYISPWVDKQRDKLTVFAFRQALRISPLLLNSEVMVARLDGVLVSLLVSGLYSAGRSISSRAAPAVMIFPYYSSSRHRRYDPIRYGQAIHLSTRMYRLYGNKISGITDRICRI